MVKENRNQPHPLSYHLSASHHVTSLQENSPPRGRAAGPVRGLQGLTASSIILGLAAPNCHTARPASIFSLHHQTKSLPLPTCQCSLFSTQECLMLLSSTFYYWYQWCCNAKTLLQVRDFVKITLKWILQCHRNKSEWSTIDCIFWNGNVLGRKQLQSWHWSAQNWTLLEKLYYKHSKQIIRYLDIFS